MDNEALDNAGVERASLYTTGIQLLPTDNSDLTLLTGSGLYFTDVPDEKQGRGIMANGVGFMHSTSGETNRHAVVSSHTVYRPGSDWFRSEQMARQCIPVNAVDRSTLVLLCGDIESNPGPKDNDVEPPRQKQKTDAVSK